MISSPPPPCTYELQASDAAWDVQARSFTPRNCRVSRITPRAARQCLHNRTLEFIGDSMVRDLAMAVGSFLGGFDNVSAASIDRGPGHKETWRALKWEQEHSGRAGLFTTLRPYGKRARAPPAAAANASVDPRRVAEHTYAFRRGARHGPGQSYTLRLNEELYHAATWPQLRALLDRGRDGGADGAGSLSGTSEAKRADVYLIGLGLHDATLHREEAYRWPVMPACWTHGRVFQPYLDYWCAALREPSREPPVPREPPALAVWMTMNEQCAAQKKGYKWQVRCASASMTPPHSHAADTPMPTRPLSIPCAPMRRSPTVRARGPLAPVHRCRSSRRPTARRARRRAASACLCSTSRS